MPLIETSNFRKCGHRVKFPNKFENAMIKMYKLTSLGFLIEIKIKANDNSRTIVFRNTVRLKSSIP